MKLYNTLTRQLEEFVPINEKIIGIYSCGPTVYWNQHVGHMYAYVQWDTMVRALRYQNYDVKWVMNITDVGHLTSDEDAGEDKMEKGAKREGLTVWQIADKYIAQFKESMGFLNISEPNVLCRATEHISEQIDLIKKIEANGFAYKTKTGLVFDTGKFVDYAKFANLNLSEQDAGARVVVDEDKKNPWDFLLWVTNQPEHIMKWDSPWGVGFPGWHIECTAMSTKYLGAQFDIHTGGIEHIPVHHTNEVAQAFGAFGRQTANYWLHNNWLLINGEKMSKSLGNNILASDLVVKGYDPLALRYLILTSHYRQGMNFTWESLVAAGTALKRLRNKFNEVKGTGRIDEGYKTEFLNAINDDLNFSKALALIWTLLDDKNVSAEDKLATILDFDRVLGLDLGKTDKTEEMEIPEEIKKLVEKREKLRKEKKFAEADKIRSKISDLGFKVSDSAGEQKITKD